MALRWTRTALRSVDEIAAFIARDKPVRATSFVQDLRDRTRQLERFPGMGRAGRVHGTRELVVHENYIAIYRCIGDQIQILRIHQVVRKL